MFDEIVKLLKSKGWEEQYTGEIYHNGAVTTNLYSPEGAIMTIKLDTAPDEEELERIRGD